MIVIAIYIVGGLALGFMKGNDQFPEWLRYLRDTPVDDLPTWMFYPGAAAVAILALNFLPFRAPLFAWFSPQVHIAVNDEQKISIEVSNEAFAGKLKKLNPEKFKASES